jgi:hypothetical protein
MEYNSIDTGMGYFTPQNIKQNGDFLKAAQSKNLRLGFFPKSATRTSGIICKREHVVI